MSMEVEVYDKLYITMRGGRGATCGNIKYLPMCLPPPNFLFDNLTSTVSRILTYRVRKLLLREALWFSA